MTDTTSSTLKTESPNILIIDPQDMAALKHDLEKRFGWRVTILTSGQELSGDTIPENKPDLIVLSANVTQPPVEQVLWDLTGQYPALPIVLIAATGDITPNDVNYPQIIGWLSRPFTTAQLALLIQTALERSLPASELVLAKRADLVDANQRLAHRVQELQTLFEIGKSVTAQLDLESVLRLVVEAAVQQTEADESYLLLLNETGGDLYLRAQANFGPEEAKNFWIKVKDSIAGQVVQTGQPLVLSKDSNVLKVKTGITVNSLANVPVKVGLEVIGVLGVNNRHQKRTFTPDDTSVLSALADWAAIAIQNAKLYAATQQFNRDLNLINEVSRLVSSTLDVDQIPRLLIQRTAEIIGAECGSLALIDWERPGVVFQLAYDQAGQELKGLKNFLMPLGNGIMGMVAKTGQPVIANNVQDHPDWSSIPDQMTGFITQKIVAVPLVAEGEIFGVVELLNKKEGDFGQDDLQLLTLVASSAASAINNARQYTALRETNQALEEVQEQRIASERWAVLGKAAANLAHRINNSTALVPIAAQHLRELLTSIEIPPDVWESIEGNLDRIERNSLYTVELAVVLLRRFRKNPTEEHDINQLVNRAIEAVDIPPHINVLRHLDPKLPAVVTSDLLIEVIVELITNAVKMMDDGPRLLRIATFTAGHRRVSIQITDNGPGIAEENIEQIFDIFYTTNPRGLGFGLWWVKTFLEQQHGDISVESVPHEHTTFTITLPRNLPALRS